MDLDELIKKVKKVFDSAAKAEAKVSEITKLTEEYLEGNGFEKEGDIYRNKKSDTKLKKVGKNLYQFIENDFIKFDMIKDIDRKVNSVSKFKNIIDGLNKIDNEYFPRQG